MDEPNAGTQIFDQGRIIVVNGRRLESDRIAVESVMLGPAAFHAFNRNILMIRRTA